MEAIASALTEPEDQASRELVHDQWAASDYSDSPAASRASSGSEYMSIRASLRSRSVQTWRKTSQRASPSLSTYRAGAGGQHPLARVVEGIYLKFPVLPRVRPFSAGRFARRRRLLAGIVIVSDPNIGFATLALLVGIAFILNGMGMFALGWSLHAAGERWPGSSDTPCSISRRRRFPCKAVLLVQAATELLRAARSCCPTGPSSHRLPRPRSQSGNSPRPRRGRGLRWRSRVARPGARSAERSRSTHRPSPVRRASRRGRS